MPASSETLDHARIVEDLGLEEFVNQQWSLIAQRLMRALEVAEETRVDTNLIFIAESLPLINGIINVGSDFQKVQAVGKEIGAGGDPLIVLSALVFRYIADRGVKLAEEELTNAKAQNEDTVAKEQDLKRWRTIRKRAYALLQDHRGP